jgi:acyl-CoA synthetase (AMP-forming)/AMP-acid ligase II/acyl carrier protein
MYGMTETVANATYAGRHPEMGPVGTIGLPVDCEVRLMAARSDHTGEESEREGEIQIRGENVFQGYWKDNVRTARTLIGDGWMRTGDLAKRRDDGSLEIVGRMSGVINMGGQSILPEEIDEALALHAAVIDVATIGTKDSEFGEIAVSAVVVDSPASEADLTLFCRQHLEPLKVPKRIIAVDEIPRGGAGKPNAEQLREMLAELLTSTVIASDTNETGKVSTAEVYELAASVFRVPTRKLDTNSSAANVNGWDSFSQLNLMIEAERRFKVRIPASQVASIRTLGDLHRAITGKL